MFGPVIDGGGGVSVGVVAAREARTDLDTVELGRKGGGMCRTRPPFLDPRQVYVNYSRYTYFK